MNSNEFEGWAIVELMGHRRLAGYVTPATLGGAAVLRVDVPTATGTVTQFYSGSALYALTPTTEATARQCAKSFADPAPVQPWEIKGLLGNPNQESGPSVSVSPVRADRMGLGLDYESEADFWDAGEGDERDEGEAPPIDGGAS